MNLRNYMRENNTTSKDNIFYNETFCNIVYDYLSSCDFTEEDREYLKENEYSEEDFLEY